MKMMARTHLPLLGWPTKVPQFSSHFAVNIIFMYFLASNVAQSSNEESSSDEDSPSSKKPSKKLGSLKRVHSLQKDSVEPQTPLQLQDLRVCDQTIVIFPPTDATWGNTTLYGLEGQKEKDSQAWHFVPSLRHLPHYCPTHCSHWLVPDHNKSWDERVSIQILGEMDSTDTPNRYTREWHLRNSSTLHDATLDALLTTDLDESMPTLPLFASRT
ncbi:hypothetical protein B0H10DRAFT_1943993 [Mycena sp. CBHHK59/15]|nr:hypothetical protein B0H10DRAFT_1943993 [Mycena sp. CBHHK59/15]